METILFKYFFVLVSLTRGDIFKGKIYSTEWELYPSYTIFHPKTKFGFFSSCSLYRFFC